MDEGENIPLTQSLRAVFQIDGETIQHDMDAFVLLTKRGPVAVRGDEHGHIHLLKDGKLLFSTAPNELDGALGDLDLSPVETEDVLNGQSPDLIRTGYWRPNEDDSEYAAFSYLPIVEEFADMLDQVSATNIARWLVENGECLQDLGGAPQWDGFHTCRFEGCSSGQVLGGKDFTNGVFVWPESLVHYVVVHRVAPMELVQWFQEQAQR